MGGRTSLTYGIDLQRTVPRTDSTITGRNEPDDFINEAGGYVHTETTLSPTVDFIAAARVDYHNRLPDVVFSPRAAIVARPSGTHAFRLTYNRAFSTPTTNNLFLDLIGGVLPTPVPTTVRLVGVPTDGFRFRRDCDGTLCMRSPYTPAALGGPETYLPVDATQLWPVLVDTLRGRGIDIAAIPTPTAAQVGTSLARLNIGTGRFEPVTGATDIPGLRPVITNSVELGYRATLLDRLSLGVDIYREWKNDFVSAERVETPSAFFDQASLASYLGGFMPADTAQLLATLIAQVPVGTVTPEEARDPWDILVTYRNFGELSYWGADLELGVILTPAIAVGGTYSWTSRHSFEVLELGAVDTIPLNAPSHRGSLTALYRNAGLGLDVELRGRAADGFPMGSGVYQGDVEAYAVVDATVGYGLPFAEGVTLTVSALNVLDHRHREFLGAPEIGRLVTARVRAEF